MKGVVYASHTTLHSGGASHAPHYSSSLYSRFAFLLDVPASLTLWFLHNLYGISSVFQFLLCIFAYSVSIGQIKIENYHNFNTVEPHSKSLIRIKTELVLQITRYTNQFLI